ncbi:Radial spoke head protein 9 [Perkinsus olseni]|uniref:Radial spoke head protein 9 homolog n=1 Tax=Perkinsus olseni TaxID=32597 RepID=A0A7J6TCD7_PEROL|nr:Radial spoke head protein 9 [Perkinsus olseni]
MDAHTFDVALKFCGGQGSTLSPQEILTIRAGLDQLKCDAKFDKVYFWGRIAGIRGSYYIAYGLRSCSDAFPKKEFYFSTSTASDFVELPELVESEEDIVKSLVDQTQPFIGVPSKLVATEKLPKVAEDEEKENAPTPLKVTDLQRLALAVPHIDAETSVVPAGAHGVSDSFKVKESAAFRGLSFADASSISSFRHFRPSSDASALRALVSDDAAFMTSSNFLDTLEEDFPKGSAWVLRPNVQPLQGATLLRSLVWPGYTAFHVPGTSLYGGVYLANLLKRSRHQGVPLEVSISIWEYLRPSIRGFSLDRSYDVETEDGNIYPVYTRLDRGLPSCQLLWVAFPSDQYVLESLSLGGRRSQLAEISLPYVHNSICATMRNHRPCITFVFNSLVTQVTGWSVTEDSPRDSLPLAVVKSSGTPVDLLVELTTAAPFSDAFYGISPGLGFSDNLLIRMSRMSGMWTCESLCTVPELIQGFAVLESEIFISVGVEEPTGGGDEQTVLQRREGQGWETLLIIPRQCTSMDIDYKRKWIYILGGSPDKPNWRLWIYSPDSKAVLYQFDMPMVDAARGGTGIAANAANITPERIFLRPDGGLWITRLSQPDPHLLDFDHRIEVWHPIVD